MGLLDGIRNLLTLEPMHERTSPFEESPDLQTRIMRLHSLPGPWRTPSITEALGVPAIQRAVTLVSNTTGSLSVQGWRNGEVMADPPRVITRPDPYSTPRDCYRDMAYNLATRGECILWIASRDSDNMATALIVVPLAEVSVDENPRNRLFPLYDWLGTKGTRYSAANQTGEFVHITYLKEPGALRGSGPLQLAGAAVSVSVEAQEWAANFYAEGGHPSTVIKSAVQLDKDESEALKGQWIGIPNNVPRIVDTNIESVTETDVNPQGAQMLEAREYQNGDAARMFGIPGSLLEYGSPGSSLTYQNLAEVWTQFTRGCLAPNYLEPIEQALSDLLARSTVARFYIDGLLRADVKTRWDVYAQAVTVLGPEEGAAYARDKEGLVPGNVEVAPVPFAAPAAVPGSIPAQYRSLGPDEVRCEGLRVLHGRTTTCGKLLSTTGQFVGQCPRCHQVYEPEMRERTVDVPVTPVINLPPPVVNVEPPVVNIPAPIVNMDSSEFAAAVDRLRDAFTPRPLVRTIERDRNGRIIHIREEQETA